MAFVRQLLREYREDAFGAVLNLDAMWSGDVGELKGVYSTATGSSSTLSGIAVQECPDGTVSLKGRWKHAEGPLTEGDFVMELTGHFGVGRWKEDGKEGWHAWNWVPRRTWLPRWGILSAWLFLGITIAQLVVTALEVDGALFQCVANIFYTAAYVSFMIAYIALPQQERPDDAYVGGVACYTVGYAVFASLYWDSRVGLYVTGSVLFLIGSAFLLWSTLRSRAMWLAAGSLAFLLGSFAFTVDSVGEKGSLTLLLVGYGCFTPGRLFFLLGSTGPEAGICFQIAGHKGADELDEALTPSLRIQPVN
eukprot:Hpha_TRINITY_DN19282_c0_g1::TRINITY_DN19282_c0_g1_i1::g.194193::m.194193